MTVMTPASTDEFPVTGISPSAEVASPFVSVVLPVYNEVTALPRLVSQLQSVFGSLGHDFELVFVDDGSTDGSNAWLEDAARQRTDLTVVHLTRNFGHQAALQAGLEEARGDVVIVMDSDLQDDPAAIPRFLEAWRTGHEVVYAVRTHRQENWLKRSLFSAFYRVLRFVADAPIPMDAGNFGLLDRRVVNHLRAMPERTRYFPGLRNWVGFRQVGVPVARLSRYDAVPRVSFWQLVRLAKTAVFSFSSFPIFAFWAITAISAACLTAGVLTAAGYGVSGHPLPDGLGTLLTISLFTTLNAAGIAVLGEYIVRILDQVQGRPAYLVDRVVRAESRPHRPRDNRVRTASRANGSEQLAPSVSEV
jgi:polyisoprenyl-phosphate glycosyltransferase